MFTKSSQNWILPLLDPDWNKELKIDKYLTDFNSKDKWGSDSLSEDNDKTFIDEEKLRKEEEKPYLSHSPSK